MNEREPPDEGMVVVRLEDWFRPPDPREAWRRDLGEQQKRTVKRRRRKPKTERRKA